MDRYSIYEDVKDGEKTYVLYDETNKEAICVDKYLGHLEYLKNQLEQEAA